MHIFFLYIPWVSNPSFYNQRKIIVFLNEFKKILLVSMTHWRSTCLIGDQHAWSETDMPHRRIHRRTTCLIGDRDLPCRRPTCLIGDTLNMLDQANQSPIRYVGIRSAIWSPNRRVEVSDETSWNPMDLR